MKIHSILLLKQLLLELFSPLPYLEDGLLGNLIFRMPSFMVTWKRKYLCGNHPGMKISLDQTIYVNWIKFCMD
jgi:hypothetical protein